MLYLRLQPVPRHLLSQGGKPAHRCCFAHSIVDSQLLDSADAKSLLATFAAVASSGVLSRLLELFHHFSPEIRCETPAHSLFCWSRHIATQGVGVVLTNIHTLKNWCYRRVAALTAFGNIVGWPCPQVRIAVFCAHGRRFRLDARFEAIVKSVTLIIDVRPIPSAVDF